MVGTPGTLGRWSTSGLMNSGAVVHSLTRRAYSSSMRLFGLGLRTRPAAKRASAITRDSLIGALLYTITLHAARWEIVMCAEDKFANANFSLDDGGGPARPRPGGTCPGQTRSYKVDFTIRDTGDAGGKTGRKYSLLVNRRRSPRLQGRQPRAGGNRSRQRRTRQYPVHLHRRRPEHRVRSSRGRREVRDARGPGYQHSGDAGQERERGTESHHLVDPAEHRHHDTRLESPP